jgi:hypothetical protein
MKTRTIVVKRFKKQCLAYVGIFKENRTYTEKGDFVEYIPGYYTSHKKGSTLVCYKETLPEYISAGSIRESIVHLVPTKDLLWHKEWIDY